MTPLNKATYTGEISAAAAACLCVAFCLIFTAKRHEDVLEVNKTVKY